MNDPQRHLAAIMFTDVVGYTVLTQQNEALALELLENHFQMLRPIFPPHGGKEIKTIGDAFMVEFSSPLNAVQCAIKMQGMMNAHNSTQTAERQIHIRIGIHVGDVEVRGEDVFGDGVNIASRIEPLAEAGGICISEHVYSQIHNKLDLDFESMGKPELKNIQAPIEVYKINLAWHQSNPATTPTAPDPITPDSAPSIAVLPFVNMSADPENEYFSDGLTDELLNALAQVEGLKVPARTSVFAFKGKNEDIQTIGRQLNVSAVLEGSVRRAENRVRVTAQLINVADGFHLWSNTYDREMDDIFAIQEEIAQAIVERITPRLAANQSQPLVKPTTHNLDAYHFYLKGTHLWNKRTEKDALGALQAFQSAIDIDPNYAGAYAGLANTYIVLTNSGSYLPGEIIPKAQEAIANALRLDESLPEANTARAQIKYEYEWDWEGADQAFRKAIELNPDYANAHHWYGFFNALITQDFEKALHEIKIAQELEPFSWIIQSNESVVLFVAGHFGQAIGSIKRVVLR